MSDFNKIVQWLLYQEDSHTHPGVTVDLGDGAGLTRLGITSKNFGLAVPGTFFSTLPFAEAVQAAKQVYKNSFWNKFNGDEIASDQVAAPLLSFSVNRNVHTAVKTLQHVLLVTPDGVLGPETAHELNQKDPVIVAKMFRNEWVNFYHTVAQMNPNDARFLDGWINRVNFPYPSPLVPTDLYA
jgi:lysozyme family protein